MPPGHNRDEGGVGGYPWDDRVIEFGANEYDNELLNLERPAVVKQRLCNSSVNRVVEQLTKLLNLL